METQREDEVLDEYEAEAARRSVREARIYAMQKAKMRQRFIRRYGLLVVVGAAIIISIIVIAVLGRPRSKSLDDHTAAAADTYEAMETADITEPKTDTDSETETDVATNDDDRYIDAEYGPFAEVYSEEKDIFFDGYEVIGFGGAAYPSEDDVRSTYALLIDADDGHVIASKGGDVRIYPASMTKIMTVLVAAEHVTDLDDHFMIDISITDYAYSHDCSTVGFALGESVTVRDLMYGTILPSGADAAVALAEYVAGSEDRFVDMMNDKLEELGLSDTAHFTNCVGIYDDDHYCTLSDMAMIMKAAVENELAKEIMNAHIYTTTKTEEHSDGIEISNWFLRRIEDKDTRGEVVCAKTGFVKESGCCGTSYEISGSGKHYICVTADAWSSWRCIYDHVALYYTYVE